MKSVLLAFCFLLSSTAFAAENSPIGIWLVGSGKAKVEVVAVGESLEGKIVWLKEPMDTEGKPRLDKNNPDKELKTKPIMGMLLVKGFVKDGENKWTGGTVYDAENGKTYKANINVENADTLKLRGYVGISLFGRTDVWKRSQLE